MIRALDIKPGERPQRWTPNRLPLHMAEATLGHVRAPCKRRLCAPWKIVAWLALLPSIGALSVIGALALVRHGL